MKKTFFLFFLGIMMVLFMGSVQSVENVTSVKIDTSMFGGKIITQTSIDKYYPCYLQQDGSVYCPVIKMDNLMMLNKLGNTTKGIPITDYRKPKLRYIEELCLLQYEECEGGTKIVAYFDGYENGYLDHTKAQHFTLDPQKNGVISIGFGSNNFTITDFVYGSCVNCSVDSSVELGNVHADSDASIVAWYQFSEEGKDSSIYGNDVTLNYAYQFHERCNFDGYADYITFADNVIPINTSFTIAYWGHRNVGGSTDKYILNCYDDDPNKDRFLLYENDGNEYRILHLKGGANFNIDNSNGGIIENEDYHFVYVLNHSNNNQTIYINGNVIASDTNGETINTSYENCYGGHIANYAYNGFLDEIIFYNRSLKYTEVTSLYNRGLYRKNGNYTSPWYIADRVANWSNANVSMTLPTSDTNITFRMRGANISRPYTNPNIVSFYPLNASSGATCDDMVGGNDGTAISTICGYQDDNTVNEGENVTYFDGKDDYIHISDSTYDYNSTSFWFYPKSSNEQIIFVGLLNKYALLFTNSKIVFNNGSVAGNRATPSLSLNEWHYVVVNDKNNKYDNLEIWVDMINQTLIESGGGRSSSKTVIGARYLGAYSIFFNGSLSYLSVYDKTINESTMLDIGHWQACELDENHKLCNITNDNSRLIQTEAYLQTRSASSNATPILQNITYNYPPPQILNLKYIVTNVGMEWFKINWTY
jgi:hypothetical protein